VIFYEKILISDKLDDTSINYLNEQESSQIHSEKLDESLLQQVAEISTVMAARQIEI